MSKPEVIRVNIEKSENHASQVKNITLGFVGNNIDSTSKESTIKACVHMQDAFEESQRVIETLESAMSNEVANIRSIGGTFAQTDNDIAGIIDKAEM